MTTEKEQIFIQAPDYAEDEIDLGDLIAVVLQAKWLIIAITLGAFFLGGAYAVLSTPIYRADGLLQVEDQKSGLGSLDISELLLEGDASVTAEIQLLKSRLVLGDAVDHLKLDIKAEPDYFPIFGRAVARRHNSRDALASAWPGLGGFAWGGESIQVDRLDVPDQLFGKELALVAGQAGTYKLYDPDGELLLDGKVGQTASQQLKDQKPLTIFVSELTARAGTEFSLERQARLKAIEDLQGRLKVSEKGKSSGILSIVLEGDDPHKVTDQVNEIANIYVRKNVERKSAEAEKTLEFLDTQLPLVKQQMESAEVALNTYRLEQGSVDLPLETQGILESIVAIEGQLIELQQKRDEVIQLFTSEHPTVKALDIQISRLHAGLGSLNQDVKELPNTQQEVLRLFRDVQVNTELYTALLNNAQELRVVKAGTVGNVRVVDHAAFPYEPVKPNKPLVLVISLLLGGFLGTTAAFIKKALGGGVEDPNLIEKQTGIPVYAVIAHSKNQETLDKQIKKGNRQPNVLAESNADDPAIESLRNLRTALHFGMMESKNNIIMIAGPSPTVGKSFVSVNLAAVLASAGKKVLLVDGDLRKGHLHQYVGHSRAPGLSELISGSTDTNTAIYQTALANLNFISTGALPPNPAELLLHDNFTNLMNKLSAKYDQIIIDSPPILAVTDATIVGRVAGASLMIIKAGVHPMREIEQSVKRLQQAEVNLRGLLFNDVDAFSRRYGAGKYSYQYDYRS